MSSCQVRRTSISLSNCLVLLGHASLHTTTVYRRHIAPVELVADGCVVIASDLAAVPARFAWPASPCALGTLGQSGG